MKSGVMAGNPQRFRWYVKIPVMIRPGRVGVAHQVGA